MLFPTQNPEVMILDISIKDMRFLESILRVARCDRYNALVKDIIEYAESEENSDLIEYEFLNQTIDYDETLNRLDKLISQLG